MGAYDAGFLAPGAAQYFTSYKPVPEEPTLLPPNNPLSGTCPLSGNSSSSVSSPSGSSSSSGGGPGSDTVNGYASASSFSCRLTKSTIGIGFAVFVAAVLISKVGR